MRHMGMKYELGPRTKKPDYGCYEKVKGNWPKVDAPIKAGPSRLYQLSNYSSGNPTRQGHAK